MDVINVYPLGNPIASLIFSVISVLPPVFYPITAIPVGYRWVAYIVPTTYSSLLADSVVGITHVTAYSQMLYLAGLAGSALIFTAVASVFTRWREK